jgi:hypothetical protein
MKIFIYARPWDYECFIGVARGILKEFGQGEIIVFTHWKEVYRSVAGLTDVKCYYMDLIDFVNFENDRFNQFELFLDKRGLSVSILKNIERFNVREDWDELLKKYFTFFDQLFDGNSILLSNQAEHFAYWLAAEVINFNGGIYFGFSVVGRPNMYTQILADYKTMYTTSVVNLSLCEFEKLLSDLESFSSISYMLGEQKSSLFSRLVQPRLNYLYNKWNNNYFLDGFPFFGRVNSLKCQVNNMWLESWKYRNFIIKLSDIPFLQKRVVLFPMHLQPEASIDVYEPSYRNQINVIERISDSLGFNDILLIKVNPKSYLSSQDFVNLSRLKNVRILQKNTPVKGLVSYTDVLIVISGTMALEFLSHGKKVIVLGSPPFKPFFKGLICADFSSLKDALSLHYQFTRESFVSDYKKYIEMLLPEPFFGVVNPSGISTVPFFSSFVSYIVNTLKNKNVKIR